MLADLDDAGGAVEVIFGALVTTGIYDRAAVQFFDGEAPTLIADGEAVHIQADSLSGLESGSTVEIRESGSTTGTSYEVRGILRYGDGAMERVSLTRAE